MPSKTAKSPRKAKFVKTSRKDGAGRVIYTKGGTDYVRRKGADGSIVHRKASASGSGGKMKGGVGLWGIKRPVLEDLYNQPQGNSSGGPSTRSPQSENPYPPQVIAYTLNGPREIVEYKTPIEDRLNACRYKTMDLYNELIKIIQEENHPRLSSDKSQKLSGLINNIKNKVDSTIQDIENVVTIFKYDYEFTDRPGLEGNIGEYPKYNKMAVYNSIRVPG